MARHIAAGQDTAADLYSGNSVQQNVAAGNDPLAAYCVGGACTNKISTLDGLLTKMGGDPGSLTDPCYRGADGNYYMRTGQ